MLAENDEKRSMVLRRLEESLKQTGIGCSLIEKGEMDSPFEILVTTHEAAGHTLTGQYYFPEYDGAENVCYFSAMVTILEEIPEEIAAELAKKAEEANLEMICGSLVIYPDAGLAYKLTLPVSETLEEGDLYETADIAVAHAIAISTAFCGQQEIF